MTGFRRTIISIFITTCFLAGCGNSIPPLQTEADPELTGNANRFIDWDAEDWKFVLPFPPMLYPASTRFDNLKYETPYADFTHYRARFSPLSLEEFRSLPQATQIKRQHASQQTLYDAMAFSRIIAWSWEFWVRSLKKQVAKEAWFYDYGILTTAIMNFEQAAAEDPSNPFTWSHLSFFTGLVGNKTRQLQALDHGFDALTDYRNHLELTPEKSKELHLMELRMLLDRAWLMRDKGLFSESRHNVKTALAMMANDDYRTHDAGREALLLEALLLVDQGFDAEARDKANQFQKWNLPIRGFSGGSMYRTKHNLDHADSDFCRQWVWDMTHMKQGNKSRALRHFGKRARNFEYPPHLGYRFWQDMGRIREHFGEKEKAWSCYFGSLMSRPFLCFYPSRITMGYTPIFGQEESGNFHFLGYHDFFLGGSEFAYAANRVAYMERAFGKNKLEKYGKDAIETLTACNTKGIRPLSSLALRGYAHTLLDQPALAEKDLREADVLLTRADRQDPQVIRLLATLCYNREAFQESHELLTRYLLMQPEDAASWRLQGVILAETGQYDEALKALNNSLELAPGSPSGLYNRALVQLHRGQSKAAQKDLKLAGDLSPGNKEISRLAMLIRSDPNTTTEFKHQPQKWSFSPPDSSGTLGPNLAAGLSGDELLTFIEKLQTDFSEKPSQESRFALCYALMENRQWADVQQLMAPLWPDKIDLQGTLLLLQADRALGQSHRAVELTQSLKTQSGIVASARLWTLVAVICHENGQKEEGNIALELALSLDPQNQALLMMQGQLGN